MSALPVTKEQITRFVKDLHWKVVRGEPKMNKPKMNENESNYIVSNQIECLKCGDKPFSMTRHDYRSCKCGAVAVDGGQSYLKRTGKVENWKELSIACDLAQLRPVIDEVGESMKSRNALGVTLAALRAIRDAEIVPIKSSNGSTVWGLAEEVTKAAPAKSEATKLIFNNMGYEVVARFTRGVLHVTRRIEYSRNEGGKLWMRDDLVFLDGKLKQVQGVPKFIKGFTRLTDMATGYHFGHSL